MANVLIEEGTMKKIANAIRKSSETNTYLLPEEMPSEILKLSGYNPESLPPDIIKPTFISPLDYYRKNRGAERPRVLIPSEMPASEDTFYSLWDASGVITHIAFGLVYEGEVKVEIRKYNNTSLVESEEIEFRNGTKICLNFDSSDPKYNKYNYIVLRISGRNIKKYWIPEEDSIPGEGSISDAESDLVFLEDTKIQNLLEFFGRYSKTIVYSGNVEQNLILNSCEYLGLESNSSETITGKVELNNIKTILNFVWSNPAEIKINNKIATLKIEDYNLKNLLIPDIEMLDLQRVSGIVQIGNCEHFNLVREDSVEKLSLKFFSGLIENLYLDNQNELTFLVPTHFSNVLIDEVKEELVEDFKTCFIQNLVIKQFSQNKEQKFSLLGSNSQTQYLTLTFKDDIEDEKKADMSELVHDNEKLKKVRLTNALCHQNLNKMFYNCSALQTVFIDFVLNEEELRVAKDQDRESILIFENCPNIEYMIIKNLPYNLQSYKINTDGSIKKIGFYDSLKLKKLKIDSFFEYPSGNSLEKWLTIKSEKHLNLEEIYFENLSDIIEGYLFSKTSTEMKCKKITLTSKKLVNCQSLFAYCPSSDVNLDIKNLKISNASGMFADTKIKSSIELDLKDCTNISRMFYNSNFTDVKLYNTNQIKGLADTFYNMPYLESIYIDELSQIKNLEDAFKSCPNLKRINSQKNGEAVLGNLKNEVQVAFMFSRTPCLKTLKMNFLKAKCSTPDPILQKCNFQEISILECGDVYLNTPSSLSLSNSRFAITPAIRKLDTRHCRHIASSITGIEERRILFDKDVNYNFLKILVLREPETDFKEDEISKEMFPTLLKEGYIYIEDNKVEAAKNNCFKLYADRIKPLSEYREV